MDLVRAWRLGTLNSEIIVLCFICVVSALSSGIFGRDSILLLRAFMNRGL